ncbi:hypothetical protein BHE74_00006085 [Ensete ventricosum]|nr:hypothetical protein GW17_00019679 [Ensete ventricosum]RWW85259.1 hypothetical protein BHE74_00006085 [Ensete ventricosum]RZS06857.1 hypothetical protein BHM03_00037612 [Ensete ventricosum]
MRNAANSNECLMTRMQEMSLDYHFTVEQEVGSSTYAFFGFNGEFFVHVLLGKAPFDLSVNHIVDSVVFFTGTAGVWRIAALNEAGGWKDRTTVEDMDLAVRASLKGWKFIFLGDLKLLTGAYLVFCGCYDLAFGKNYYYLYLFFQALAFFIVGFGYVGTFVPHP